jgi:hypothetical protein
MVPFQPDRPPIIDVSKDWVVFDNQQPITLQNQNDTNIKYLQYALQEGIDTIMADMGDGSLGFRSFCTWHVWKDLVDPYVPQINCKLTQLLNGSVWYVANVNLNVWGNKYQLDCELQAGQAVTPLDLPVPRGTTPPPPITSTPFPTPSPSPSPTLFTPTPTPSPSPTPSPTPTQNLVINGSGTLPVGVQGQPYLYQFTATGGTGTYTNWSVIAGVLP